MKKLVLGPLSAAAVMMAGAMSGAVVSKVEEEVKAAPKPKRKPKRKRRAKAVVGYNQYSRSKYIPGGEHRNCGDNGISPKNLVTHG